jgi:hypothetical protein
MHNVSPICYTADDLGFFVSLSDGSGYSVDLSELAYGGKNEDRPARSRHSWRGDYAGRPHFALQFATMIKSEKLAYPNFKLLLSGIREVFRFLDADQAAGGSPVTCLQEITDAHGPALQQWVGYDRPSRYAKAKRVMDAMRRFHNMKTLFWNARERLTRTRKKALGKEAIRAIHMSLRTEARQLKIMHREGTDLAKQGTLPPISAVQRAHWQNPTNRARLIRDTTAHRLKTKAELKHENHYWHLVNQRMGGPSYVAPCMGARADSGWCAGMRWFHPGYFDIAILLWMFLLGTGWNLSTALSLDISTMECWTVPHLTNKNRVAIHAVKNRSKSRHIAHSDAKAEWHPYRIVLYAIEITASLRRTLAHELKIAQDRYTATKSERVRANIVQLEARIRSPWLYFLSSNLGSASSMDDNDASHLRMFIREVVKKHGLLTQYPELESLSPSKPRTTWIQTAFSESHYNVLIAKLAGQHKHLSTTKHYLMEGTYREHSEAEVRKVFTALFSEISEGRLIDLTRLKLLVANGTITADQESRLRDPRYRTRVGAGCLSPYDPPHSVAPDHIAGHLCRIQRCTLCKHGVFFAESLDSLARTLAELIQIMRTMPLSSWNGSSYQDEYLSITETLKLFPTDQVDDRLSHWIARFDEGELDIHDTYPTY